MDIILSENNQGVIVAEDGLYQYDFSGLPNQTNSERLSFLSVSKANWLDFYNNSDTVKEGNIYYYKWYKEYFADTSEK